MNEADWQAATDPDPMLEFLHGKLSERKLRLFAVACCRQFWGLLTDERSRQAVVVAERFADGLADEAERTAADTAAAGAVRDAILARQQNYAFPEMFIHAARAVKFSVSEDIASDGARVIVSAYRLIALNPDSGLSGRRAVNVASSALLSDIFGNPFRPAPAVVPAMLAWQGGAVVKLARAAYDGRKLPDGTPDPARLAVLADALEDAGCADAELLGHLRGPGPHVRGCFAVDLLLGKS